MIKELKNLIDKSNKIVIFTGAGMSTESGIPDYRGSNGIYTKNKSSDEIIKLSESAAPNKGHEAIKALYDEGKLLAIITQNIDQLHQKSGIPNNIVHELHGSGNNVVHFGHQLDKTVWFKAEIAINKADLVLILGTSLTVYPAVELVEKAQYLKIPNVIINYQATEYDKMATLVINDSIGETLNECLNL